MTHGHTNLIVAEAGPFEISNSLVGAATIFENSDYCRTLIECHGVSPGVDA